MQIFPILPTTETTHRTIYLHLDQPYDPPTFVNVTHYQQLNRANLHTPTAFIWHLRYACKSADVLKHTQRHVEGLNVQMGLWSQLKQLIPCSACLAGKMKKTRKTPVMGYTDINNLAVSWLPGTNNKISTPNELVSLDWGIINKKNKPNVNNVFAIYLDNHTGFVFVYLAESRGQAGPSLQAFIQQHGTPKTIVNDNAQEFCHGTFAQICTDKTVQQQPTPPYDHNKNPTEKYMDILTSMTRCLLFISGLDPILYWDRALLHATAIQNRTALTGRPTPYEGQFGKRPNVTNFRIFGCEAMAYVYVEKEKRTKLDNKVERTIYLEMSPDHSDDTAKLLFTKTKQIIYRRNVYYNERSFPARKRKFSPTLTSVDTGEDLLDLQFLDDDTWWTIKDFGTHKGRQVLWYTNNENGQEEKLSVKEVREWYVQPYPDHQRRHSTHLRQQYNHAYKKKIYQRNRRSKF
jgi:hypothetical protein